MNGGRWAPGRFRDRAARQLDGTSGGGEHAADELAGEARAESAQEQGLQHLTLDTGHTRVSLRAEVAGEVLGRLYPLTRAGRWRLDPAPGGPAEIAVTVDGSAALVTVYRGSAPLVTFAVAADDQAAGRLWPLIAVPAGPAGPAGGYPAARPTATPWLAARLEIGVTLYPGDLAWLGDFERCWAWAWLDGKG